MVILTRVEAVDGWDVAVVACVDCTEGTEATEGEDEVEEGEDETEASDVVFLAAAAGRGLRTLEAEAAEGACVCGGACAVGVIFSNTNM